MPGMEAMMANMWIWMIAGVLLIVILVAAIVKLIQKR